MLKLTDGQNPGKERTWVGRMFSAEFSVGGRCGGEVKVKLEEGAQLPPQLLKFQPY